MHYICLGSDDIFDFLHSLLGYEFSSAFLLDFIDYLAILLRF